MFLERRTVSRKTPGDGRLEISSEAAARLRAGGAELEIEVGGERSPGRVEEMTCACAKANGRHEHHFVVGRLLRMLEPATDVELHLEGSAEGSAVRPLLVVSSVR